MPRRFFLATKTGKASMVQSKSNQQKIARRPKSAPGLPAVARKAQSIEYRILLSVYRTNTGVLQSGTCQRFGMKR